MFLNLSRKSKENKNVSLVGNISGSSRNFSHIGITGSVIVADTTNGSFPSLPGSDVVFFVSGSISGSGIADDKSVFGGDVVISGTLFGLNGTQIIGDVTEISGDTLELSGTLLVSGNSVFDGDLTVSGTIFGDGGIEIAGSALSVTGSLFVTGSSVFDGNLIVSGTTTAVNGFSGSLTRLNDGTSYLIAGNNVSIVSGTNGSVTISNTMALAPDYFASTTAGAVFTTGSAAFRGGESAVDAPSDKGSDIFFYVSGSASRTAAAASDLGTGVSLFGGDVVVSGSVIVSGAMLQGELYDWASIAQYGYYPGTGSFTHGNGTIATGDYSHAEGGNLAWSSGSYSHAEGYGTLSEGGYSHAEGNSTWAAGLHSHAEGKNTTATGEAAHAEGSGTHAVGNYSHAEGVGSWAYGLYSHAEGASYAVGTGSHSEGYNTYASGNYAYSRGSNTYAIGNYSHADGVSTKAIGDYSHAEGLGTFASGAYSHSEGQSTITSGSTSHAEGYLTVAIGTYSHAEGTQTTAPGLSSHAEGYLTVASGSYSHAEGYYTIASGSYQTVVGKANKRSNTSSLFVVGNGSGDTDVNRSDVLRVEQSSLQVTGSILGSGIISAATGFSGSLTRLNDGTSYLIAGSNVTITTGSSGAVTIASSALALPKFGNTLVVDAVNGNDGTGAVNGQPFATPEAAIAYIVAHSLTSVTVWIMPGTYNLAAGITIPNTCAIRGLNTQTCTLVLNAVGSATMITMGTSTRIEDLTCNLNCSASSGNLIGIDFPGGTAANAKIRTCVITVDNSSASTGSVIDVYGINASGTGTFSENTFSFNTIRGTTINVKSNGGGNKRGIYVGGSAQFSTRDTNVFVATPTDTSSTGRYVGAEADSTSCQLQLNSSSVYGPAYAGVTNRTSVRAMSTSNITLSGAQTIDGVAIIAGDRVLVAGQTNAINNGIYVAAAGSWTRAADMAAASNASNAWMTVNEGTVHASQGVLCSNAPAVVGTDSLIFTISVTGADTKVIVCARYTGGAPTGSRAAQGTYTPVTGDRIFLDGATSAINNGLWNYNSAGAWTRTIDMPVGSNSLNSYFAVIYGTDIGKGYICTTTGTVGTNSLTFVQKYLGSDVLQLSGIGSKNQGIQIGPGVNLVSRSCSGKPFTVIVKPITLNYGLQGNINSGIRYLWTGVQTASDATQVFYRFQQKSIVYGMCLSCRNAPGADTVKVSVMRSTSGLVGSGVLTPMNITFSGGDLQGSNYSTSIEFGEGEYLGLQIDSTGGVTNVDMVVQVDVM